MAIDNEIKKFYIRKNNVGEALYSFLRQYYSHRFIKALLKEKDICVNGSYKDKHYILQEHDCITLNLVKQTSSCDIDILFTSPDIIAVYKPPHIHTAHIAGSKEPSLESILQEGYEFYSLCTRLDYITSGIIWVARTQKAYTQFRNDENNGHIQKLYLALVEGYSYPQELKNRIDTNKRKKSKVYKEEHSEWIRYTHIISSSALHIQGYPCSLVQCRIYKGVRHQIRAHLAYSGTPLVGDILYGAQMEDFPCFLHNSTCIYHDCVISIPPPLAWNSYIPLEYLKI